MCLGRTDKCACKKGSEKESVSIASWTLQLKNSDWLIILTSPSSFGRRVRGAIKALNVTPSRYGTSTINTYRLNLQCMAHSVHCTWRLDLRYIQHLTFPEGIRRKSSCRLKCLGANIQYTILRPRSREAA